MMKNKLLTAGIVLSILANFILALFLVWINAQRAGLAHELSKQQKAMLELTDNNAKLAIMRDKLFSPAQLEAKAAGLGLRSASPGQKRFVN
ncbi:MAG: hypothetical protein LBM00_08685 [Deltaproteobacteria bacterium]|jgi:hypothetical protein|nr:hypothetical protein [Deltaproteobacteria bacterium]